MNFSNSETKARDVWFDDEDMWVLFTDGRKLAVPLAYFPRLHAASSQQRENFVISAGGYGLHWDDLDEDILVSNLITGAQVKTAV